MSRVHMRGDPRGRETYPSHRNLGSWGSCPSASTALSPYLQRPVSCSESVTLCSSL